VPTREYSQRCKGKGHKDDKITKVSLHHTGHIFIKVSLHHIGHTFIKFRVSFVDIHCQKCQLYMLYILMVKNPVKWYGIHKRIQILSKRLTDMSLVPRHCSHSWKYQYLFITVWDIFHVLDRYRNMTSLIEVTTVLMKTNHSAMGLLVKQHSTLKCNIYIRIFELCP